MGDNEPPKDVCADCKRKVRRTDEAVECEVCEIWFHNKCQNVSDALYPVLQDKTERVSWYCNYCSRGAKPLMKKLQKLSVKQVKTEEEVKKISERVKAIEDVSIGKLIPDMDEKITSKVEEEIEEYRERELRKCNLILHNVPESKKESTEERKVEDTNMVKQIQSEIKAQPIQITSVIRLGAKTQGGKPRIMKVEVANVTQKRSMLQNAKSLRKSEDEKMKKIYISPDLSKRAREKGKKLREELTRRRTEGDENITIRRGKIVAKETAEAAANARTADKTEDKRTEKDGNESEDDNQDQFEEASPFRGDEEEAPT